MGRKWRKAKKESGKRKGGRQKGRKETLFIGSVIQINLKRISKCPLLIICT